MPTPTESLADRAAGQLAFIRDTMSRAGRFTAVSGTGTVLAGVCGLTAAIASPWVTTPTVWLWLWLTAAGFAMTGAIILMARKANRSGQSLRAGPGRTFALAFAPALAAGAVFTVVLAQQSLWSLLPGTWLTCYGAAVISGGAFSVRVVPAMGVTLFLLGVAAFLTPPAMHPWLLGAGFGVVHLGFGTYIARHHGG